jgi:hypothetical protein
MPDGRGEGGFLPWRSGPPRPGTAGGAPGGAARPKQAILAREFSCGARRARSASEWQHSPAWRGHDPGASRRCIVLRVAKSKARTPRCVARTGDFVLASSLASLFDIVERRSSNAGASAGFVIAKRRVEYSL